MNYITNCFAAKVVNYVTHCFSYKVLALLYSTQITFFILFRKNIVSQCNNKEENHFCRKKVLSTSIRTKFFKFFAYHLLIS